MTASRPRPEASLGAPGGPRLPLVSDTPENPELAAAFARLRERWQGAPVLHLYRMLGWAPRLVEPWLDFASAMRFRVDSPASLRELLIVRSGQLLDAEYEWKHHWTLALEAGVPEEKLRALEDWKSSGLFNASERAVLALADETSVGAGATETTMRELAAHFSEQEIVELVITAGYYAGVGRIINSLAVPLEEGHETMSPRDS